MSQVKDIQTDVSEGVCTITFNRVEKKNCITAAMYSAMADALAQAAQDASVRVVIFQGHESVFCAGNDLADFLNAPPSGQDSPVMRFLAAIASFPKPLVAAVCGPAVGIGTTLLLHCDLVYAGDNALFSMPFVNLGLCPEAASSLLVPQLVGHKRAAQALLLGEPFLAEEAQEWGLVNRIVAPSEANALARAQALKLAAKPLSSLLETKRLLKSTHAQQVTERIADEGAIFLRMLREPAAREAMSAFMEKRKPDFSKV